MALPETVLIEVLSFCDPRSALSWSSTRRENRDLLANTLRSAPEFLLRSWGTSLRYLEETGHGSPESRAVRLIHLAIEGTGAAAVRAGFRFRPGKYRVSGWTRNAGDKNLTSLGPGVLEVDAEGRALARIPERSGSRYNQPKTSVWTGSVAGGRADLSDDAREGMKFAYEGAFSASHRLLRGTYFWQAKPHIAALGTFELRVDPVDGGSGSAADPWARVVPRLVDAPALRAFGAVRETGAVGGAMRAVAAERAGGPWWSLDGAERPLLLALRAETLGVWRDWRLRDGAAAAGAAGEGAAEQGAGPRGVVLRGAKAGERFVLSASGAVEGCAVLPEPTGRVEIALRGTWTVGADDGGGEEREEDQDGAVVMIGGLPDEARAPLAGEAVLVSIRGTWHVPAAPSVQGRFVLRLARPAAGVEERA